MKKAVVDGMEIEYWRGVQKLRQLRNRRCRSGTNQCYTGTASGKSLKKGLVGMRYDWYIAMGGQQLYIPGYGYAYQSRTSVAAAQANPGIDLGYSDSDWQQWNSWVTVYFLAPVPPNIIYDLQ